MGSNSTAKLQKSNEKKERAKKQEGGE